MKFGKALALLELEWPTSESDIRAAVRRLSLVHHPDHGGDDAKMRDVIAARDLLLGMGDLLPHAFKRCATCKMWHPRYEFYSDTDRTDGLERHCRWCSNKRRIRRMRRSDHDA